MSPALIWDKPLATNPLQNTGLSLNNEHEDA